MLTDYRLLSPRGLLAALAQGGYNRGVLRLLCTISLSFVFLTACRDELQTKEKVQQAVVERLQSHSGLDLKDLDVNTTDVKFENKKATATVAFHSKSDANVNSGMTMNYSLEERDGKWVVTGVNNAAGSPLSTHPPMPGASNALPAGHPAIPDSTKQ